MITGGSVVFGVVVDVVVGGITSSVVVLNDVGELVVDVDPVVVVVFSGALVRAAAFVVVAEAVVTEARVVVVDTSTVVDVSATVVDVIAVVDVSGGSVDVGAEIVVEGAKSDPVFGSGSELSVGMGDRGGGSVVVDPAVVEVGSADVEVGSTVVDVVVVLDVVVTNSSVVDT